MGSQDDWDSSSGQHDWNSNSGQHDWNSGQHDWNSSNSQDDWDSGSDQDAPPSCNSTDQCISMCKYSMANQDHSDADDSMCDFMHCQVDNKCEFDEDKYKQTMTEANATSGHSSGGGHAPGGAPSCETDQDCARSCKIEFKLSDEMCAKTKCINKVCD